VLVVVFAALAVVLFGLLAVTVGRVAGGGVIGAVR
jgi:hypothetical protein